MEKAKEFIDKAENRETALSTLNSLRMIGLVSDIQYKELRKYINVKFINKK